MEPCDALSVFTQVAIPKPPRTFGRHALEGRRRYKQADCLSGVVPRLMGAPVKFAVGRILDPLVAVSNHLSGILDDIAVGALADRCLRHLVAIVVRTAGEWITPALRH